jgi:hypothetical protein
MMNALLDTLGIEPRPLKTRMYVRQFKSIGIVDKGACEGAKIIVAKRGDKPMGTNTKSVREQAWDEIVRGGEEVQKQHPELSAPQARLRYQQTDEGRALRELYDDPDAHLSETEFTEKKRIVANRVEKLGCTMWDEKVTALIRQFAPSVGGDRHKARALVKKHLPTLWEAYEIEKRERNRR